MRLCALLFVLSWILTNQAEGQGYFKFQGEDPSGTILPALRSEVQARLGPTYGVYFAVFDSMIGKSMDRGLQEEITDPLGTLNGTVFFYSHVDEYDPQNLDSVAIGMFKDGQVLWMSTPTFSGEPNQVYATRDLNKDGSVDIVLLWSPSYTYSDIDEILVLSWDGTTARVISGLTSQNEPTLVTSGSLDLIDPNGNGIYVLRAYWSDEEEMQGFLPRDVVSTRPWVTYSWNGVKYVLAPAADQIPGNAFLPANKLTVSASCFTTRVNGLYNYHYTFFNHTSSQQVVQSINIAGTTDTSLAQGALNKVLGDSSSPASLRIWAPEHWFCGESRFVSGREYDVLEIQLDYMIKPGKSLGGFSYQTKNLPSVVKFYAQGLRPHAFNPISAAISDEQYRNDMLLNSYSGLTVGAVAPPVPFNPPNFLDSLKNNATQSRSLGWIKNQATADKYLGHFNSAKINLQQNNMSDARATLGQVLNDVDVDSTSNLTSEAYALIRFNTEYLLSQLPTNPAPGLAVRLTNSGGTTLPGGSLQYYEGSWKDAINNSDGTFNVNTTLTSVSLRMTYAYGSQTKSNVPVNGGPVTFQTVNTQVKLQNSQGAMMDQGTVQYYAGAWRDFGVTSNGVAAKELLPASYSFRTTYAGGSNDKQQDIGANPTIVFQTVNAAVQLKNSQGNLMDAGNVQYYAGAWRDFGATTNGIATKELLPANYSFRITYAFASKDMQQNIGANPTVVFSTVNATVQLKNSQGNLIDAGTVQYYSGAWRDFGTTSNGSVSKELLANNYSFRMTYEFVSNDKAQDIGAISTVGFSTVLCTVRVSNATGQPVSGAVVSYYSGAWRQIGSTVNGQITKELLPANLSFRASYGGRSQDKAQNLSTNAVVEIVLP